MKKFTLNPAESFLFTERESSPQQNLFPWLPGETTEPESTWVKTKWISQARLFANRSRDSKVRGLAHTAERIRPLCCNHRVDAKYPWKWPDASENHPVSAQLSGRCSHEVSSVPSHMRNPHFLTSLRRQISTEIAQGLSQPCPVFEDRHSVRVEFMQRLAWVAIKNPFRLCIEVRDRDGHWHMTSSTFALHNPTASADWISQVLMPWLPSLSLLEEQEAQAAYEWLCNSLREQFHLTRWLRGLKRQLRFHMNVLPAFSSLLTHFGRLQGSLELDEAQYQELWTHRAFWAGFHRRHPGMSYFYYLATEYGLILEQMDLGVLRQRCLTHGLSPAAWRFLGRHGYGAIRAAITSSLSPEHCCENAMSYIEWQSRAGLDAPLPIPLGRNFITVSGMFLNPEEIDRLDPRIASVASDHWRRLRTSQERRQFADQDWVNVLLWLRDQQPRFDRNQWRAGWTAIWRAHCKWLSLHQDDSRWESCLATFDHKVWRIKPLTSAYQLAREGLQMRHCVSAYARRCLTGDYRLFSVTCQFTGKNLATIGLIRRDEEWEVDQVKGVCNRESPQVIRQLADQILKRYLLAEKIALSGGPEEQKGDLQTSRASGTGIHIRVSRFCGPSLLQIRRGDGEWAHVKPEDCQLPRKLIEKIRSVSGRLALIPPCSLPGEDEWQDMDDLVFDLGSELREALPADFRIFRDDGFAGNEIEIGVSPIKASTTNTLPRQ